MKERKGKILLKVFVDFEEEWECSLPRLKNTNYEEVALNLNCVYICAFLPLCISDLEEVVDIVGHSFLAF